MATIRQARGAVEPDPVLAALLAELAGAQGITVHLRGDRRHINERDIRLLREVITTQLNIEMAATEEMVMLASELAPDVVTLVPEREREVTTEGGLNVMANEKDISQAVKALQKTVQEVSLFVDPQHDQIKAAAIVGATLVEINTAMYAEAVPKGLNETDECFTKELDKVAVAAEVATSIGMRALAGHGLTYRNVQPVSDIEAVVELNIGHNIVSRAVLVGMERAVREMLDAMNP